MQQEMEWKFAVGDDTALPEVVTLGEVVTHHLEATYYDTEDLVLTREKITVRRRVGGKDDGWHIKFPGKTARLEAHFPLSEQVPGQLIDALQYLLLSAQLVPIAVVRNTRQEVQLHQVEFCDDRVSTTCLLTGEENQWREWEIEAAAELHPKQAAKALATVAEYLREAGAVPASSPSKLAAALGAALPTPYPDSVLEGLRQGIIDADRRLREGDPSAKIYLYGVCCGLTHLCSDNPTISVGAQQLAHLCLSATEASVVAKLASLRDAPPAFIDSCEKSAARLEQRVVKALDHPRYREFRRAIDALAATGPNMDQQITKLAKRVIKLAKSAGDVDYSALQDLCYALVVLEPVSQKELLPGTSRKQAKKYRRIARACTQLTIKLVDHDVFTATAQAMKEKAAYLGSHDAFTLGGIHAGLARQITKQEKKIAKAHRAAANQLKQALA